MLVSFTRIGGCPFSFSRIVIRTLYLSNSGQAIPSTFGKNEISETDGNRMQQVFINLVDNAIRYTNNGFITLKVKNEKTFIYIEITDTGIGIPEGELPFIFDRFHRVEKSRSREYGGTGLGLAIVKKLVDLQGGSISVSSQVGVGTTFRIEFPISKEERLE